MTSNAANGFAVFILSLGLMLGAASTVAKAAGPNTKSTSSVKYKKPKAGSASQGTTANNSGGGAQASGKHTHGYAKSGRCNPGCGPTELPYAVRNATATHAPAKPRQVKTTLPKNWANGQNCGLSMPDDPHWAEEKAACAAAPNALSRTGKGIPTWPDTHPDTASDDVPKGTIIDRKAKEIGQGAADAIEQAVTDDVSRAHGAQPACSSNSSAAEDAASGCHY